MTQKSAYESNSPPAKKNLRNKIRVSLLGFLHGDMAWARIRMFFLMVMVGLMASMLAYLFEVLTPIRLWHSLIFPLLSLLGVFLISPHYDCPVKMWSFP